MVSLIILFITRRCTDYGGYAISLKILRAECCNLKRACYNAHHLIHHGDENDPVAQLDRVSVSEAGGHEFDSHRGRQSRSYWMRKWRNW